VDHAARSAKLCAQEHFDLATSMGKILLGLLFFAGYRLARYTTARPALTGLLFLRFGADLFAMSIALGGRINPSMIREDRMTAQKYWKTRAPRRLPLVLAGALISDAAKASMFAGEALDTAADVLSWIVLIIVPIVGIAVFWLVHILPEKVAEAKRHPQAKAIQVLCLLSLVFGGLLWPLAWLWAYSKPVMYKMAYGTDVSDEHHGEAGGEAAAGIDAASQDEIARLRTRLATLEARAAQEARG
jgi:hypothetical protein